MPGDAVHIKWAMRAVAIGAAFLYYLNVEVATIIICSGLVMFFTMYWSPDIDLKCKAYYRWGVLKLLIFPFVKLFSHRKLSHHPVGGPIVLSLYFALVMSIINFVFMRLWVPIIQPVIDKAQDMHTQIITLSPTKETYLILLIVFGCLTFACEVHYIIDYTMKGDREE